MLNMGFYRVIKKPLYIGIAIFIFIIFLPGYIKFMKLKIKSSHLEREIEHLEKENISLHKEKRLLENDINYLEKVARNTLGLARKGEIPLRIEIEK